MSTERDVNRIVRSWMEEGVTALPDHVLDAVLDQVPATPQRQSIWLARRIPSMNNALRLGLIAAAVVIIAVIAINLLPGSPGPGGQPTPSPSDAPSATSTPELLAYAMSIPGISGGEVTVYLPDGWSRNGWYVQGHDVYMNVWPAPIANVYGDPCQWEGSLPDPPVGPTVDDLAIALVNQSTRNATMEDASLGGYSGKVVHMSVPADINFTDCDLSQFASWTEPGDDQPARYHQAPGQMDDVYILDVEGVRVVINAATFPTSAAADVAELEEILATLTIQP